MLLGITFRQTQMKKMMTVMLENKTNIDLYQNPISLEIIISVDSLCYRIYELEHHDTSL